MQTTLITISSTPEQFAVLHQNKTVAIPWDKAVELLPDIFSIEDIYAITYEPSMNVRHVIWTEQARSRWIEENIVVDELAPIRWLDNNLQRILEEVFPFLTEDEDVYLHTAYNERHIILHETDWLVSRHLDQKALNIPTTLTEEDYTSLLLYRQQLRDLGNTQNMSLPFQEVEWPIKPAWITNLPGSHLYESSST